MRVHKLTNVTTALKVLEKNRVSTHFCNWCTDQFEDSTSHPRQSTDIWPSSIPRGLPREGMLKFRIDRRVNFLASNALNKTSGIVSFNVLFRLFFLGHFLPLDIFFFKCWSLYYYWWWWFRTSSLLMVVCVIPKTFAFLSRPGYV